MFKNALSDTVNWKTRKWSNFTTKSQALIWMISSIQARRTRINWRIVRSLLTNCLEMLVFGRPDTLWSVNKLAISLTKWTQACDRRLAKLISYIHHTNDFRQYCHVGHTAQRCRLGLLQDSNCASDLEDSNINLRRRLGSRTFFPVSWMCKKQTSVSHKSTESEIISEMRHVSRTHRVALDWLFDRINLEPKI